MSVDVLTVYDSKRGCGWRASGAMYLVSGDFFDTCGKLPAPIEVCECCGAGVRVTRGLTRIKPARLFAGLVCKTQSRKCGACLINAPDGFIMGVGTKYYDHPRKFLNEALAQGISKRIAKGGIPRGFKVGESVVLLSHANASTRYERQGDDLKAVKIPGVICAFIPKRIEYITKGTETEEQLERLVERGITPVNVVRVEAKRTGDRMTSNPATPHEYRPGKLGHLHEDVIDRGITCLTNELWSGTGPPTGRCLGIMRFTHETLTDSPPGSRMVYALYECNVCGAQSALVSNKQQELV